MARERQRELRNANWEIFVLVLSLVSFVNIVLLLLPLHDDSDRVILVIDGSLCLVFLADFLYRLRAAASKREYFFRRLGWLDLLGSVPVPGFRIARALRVILAVRGIRRHGGRRVWRDFVRERAQGAMYVVLLLVVIVLEFSSIAVLSAERDAEGANIATASDALWWGYVTITTVGYGDRFPVTDEGRVVGFLLLTIGVGLFGTFTAFIANVFLAPRGRRGSHDRGDVADLRSLLDEHERLAEQIRRGLDELETRATHPAPP
jgi:voltage-gated potassium channel Kch